MDEFLAQLLGNPSHTATIFDICEAQSKISSAFSFHLLEHGGEGRSHLRPVEFFASHKLLNDFTILFPGCKYCIWDLFEEEDHCGLWFLCRFAWYEEYEVEPLTVIGERMINQWKMMYSRWWKACDVFCYQQAGMDTLRRYVVVPVQEQVVDWLIWSKQVLL